MWLINCVFIIVSTIFLVASACDTPSSVSIGPDVEEPADAFLAKPTAMPQDVYEAIKTYGGFTANINVKNSIIPQVAKAIEGPAQQLKAAITAAIKPHVALDGLDVIIINLLVPTGAGPTLTPQAQSGLVKAIYDVIANHPQATILQKNAIIAGVKAAMVKTPKYQVSRDIEIMMAVFANGNHANLADDIKTQVDLYDPISAPPPPPQSGPVLIAKPAGMSQSTYDLIHFHGGHDKHILIKNSVIPLIAAAIVGPEQDRDANIIAAIAPHAELAGLDMTIINLSLPPVLIAQPTTMANDVYAAIKNHGGAGVLIGDKNAVIPLIDAAINGPEQDRDAAIKAGVKQFSALVGLDAAVIALLKPILMVKPANTPADVYDVIKNFAGVNNHIPSKNLVIPLIDDAIAGGAGYRDAEIRNAVQPHAVLAGLDNAIINLLPQVLMALPANMKSAVYAVIVIHGGQSNHIAAKNDVIPRIAAALAGPLAARDAAIRAAVALHPVLTGLDALILKFL